MEQAFFRQDRRGEDCQPEPNPALIGNPDMPVYERADGSRFQVIGGSILGNEAIAKTDAVDLTTRQQIREEPMDLYRDTTRLT